MPGLDIGHIALLLGIALVVFGPEKLMEMSRTLGKTLQEFQRASREWPDLLRGQNGEEDSGTGESTPSPVTEEGEVGGEAEMTFMEHFGELRSRIVWAVLPILLTATICFFFSDQILRLLKGPAGSGFQINAFGPMDGFVIKWKVALYAGLVLASPNWIYQLLAFISPGLTPRERRFLVPTMIAVFALLVVGTIFGYVLLAGMVRVMVSMFGSEINYLPNANQYISFVVFFMLACGLVFELPAVLLVLVKLGVLRPDVLRRQRKIAYFLLFAFAEIVTPVADPIVAPMVVMLPLVVLYEGAIFATRWVVPDAGRQAAGASN